MEKQQIIVYRRMRAGDGPAWRWQRVQDLLAGGRRPDRLDDETTKLAWQFGCASAGANNRMRRSAKLQSVAASHAIYMANEIPRWEIEARLIAGFTTTEIAERVRIDLGVINTYIATFFDVVGRTDSIGWLASFLPIGIFTPSDPTEAEIWMHVAATGDGAKAALDVLIADFRSLAEPALPDRHQVAEDIRTLVRFSCTPAAPTAKYRRLLRQMWRILSTRVTVHDPKQWESIVSHMDFLELVAGSKDRSKPSPACDGTKRREQCPDQHSASTGSENQSAASAGDEEVASDAPDLRSRAFSHATLSQICWPKWTSMAGLAVA